MAERCRNGDALVTARLVSKLSTLRTEDTRDSAIPTEGGTGNRRTQSCAGPGRRQQHPDVYPGGYEEVAGRAAARPVARS